MRIPLRIDPRILLLLALFGVSSACRNSTPSPPLTFLPSRLPDAQVGESYDTTITVSGAETPIYKISADEGELPEGLTLLYEPDEGVARITGIPERAGVYEFTITASCFATSRSGQKGEMHYTLTVK